VYRGRVVGSLCGPDQMLERLRRLYQHMEWSNRRVLGSLRAADTAPAEAVELFAHVLGTEHRWFTRITGRDPRVPVWPEASLDTCESLSKTNTADYSSLLEHATADVLSRQVHYTNSAGDDFESRVDDILLHVVLHGMYHRGQVALTLRREGQTPSPTDFIAFVRGAATATRVPTSIDQGDEPHHSGGIP